jgi:hypothetical protein
MQQLHRGVLKPLRQATQDSTELTRSLRNWPARIVLVVFGVIYYYYNEFFNVA